MKLWATKVSYAFFDLVFLVESGQAGITGGLGLFYFLFEVVEFGCGEKFTKGNF